MRQYIVTCPHCVSRRTDASAALPKHELSLQNCRSAANSLAAAPLPCPTFQVVMSSMPVGCAGHVVHAYVFCLRDLWQHSTEHLGRLPDKIGHVARANSMLPSACLQRSGQVSAQHLVRFLKFILFYDPPVVARSPFVSEWQNLWNRCLCHRTEPR